MPFRTSFDCLWCGTRHTTRSPDDLEGWAQLCPNCVGKAGDNGFLRFRLRQALAERSEATRGLHDVASAEPLAPPGGSPSRPAQPAGTSRPLDVDREMIEYYAARAPEYDDWYLRRGRYSHGPIHDAAWNAELDAAGRWLDALPIAGEIVELAAGTGWWSPLMASKGELSLYDAAPETLERARERLVAHGLRAHLHVRDAWADPDRTVDALFTGFWLSHVPRDRLLAFLALARSWLKPGGHYALIDSLPDLASGAIDHPPVTGGRSVRRLADGREFTVVKVHYTPDELQEALAATGFTDVVVTTTGRFFLLGSAAAP